MRIPFYKYPEQSHWEELVQRPAYPGSSLEKTVKKILINVKEKGDNAVRQYTKKFDGIHLKQLRVSEKELREAENLVSAELKMAIQQAKSNIEQFHLSQQEEIKITEPLPGIHCWRRSADAGGAGINCRL